MLSYADLPGSSQQQRLLQSIHTCYEHDDRILAVLIFGSLGQDRGDAYSDLDLEVVVRDNISIDMPTEVERVCSTFTENGERTLFTEHAGNEAYLVVDSLIGVALSYHPLKSMTPYVAEGWRVLLGTLDAGIVHSAASANQPVYPPLSQHVHRALWLALSVDLIVSAASSGAHCPGCSDCAAPLSRSLPRAVLASAPIRSLRNKAALN